MTLPEAEGARVYQELLQRAETDATILAFWLGGSRGMGRPTEFSDYDVGVIVTEEGYEPFCRELGFEGPFMADWRPNVDLMVRTFAMFEGFAGWGTDEAPFSYTFAHLKALVDKTGRAQPLIDAKARIPQDAVARFVHDSLDHALNQAYRALKCLRDGDPFASQLEAAEGVTPFLDAAFALHEGRLRPYYKYLTWELETYPLSRLPFSVEGLTHSLGAVLAPGGGPVLSRLLRESHAVFHADGHGSVYDGWGGKLDWILAGRPVDAPL